MKYLVLDLETVPDRDPALPKPKKKRDGTDGFPSAPYHQVAVMGAALIEGKYSLRRIWVVGENRGAGEAATLGALTGFLTEHYDTGGQISLVSFNGRGFDLPVINARCLRHGLAFPWYHQQREARYRYTPEGHFDLMDYLVDYGASQFFSMHVAARLIGLPGKLDCKGSDVSTMIAAGQLEQVRSYCLQDVAQTTAIFYRVQFLRGEINVTEYVKAMLELLETIRSEPRLAPLSPWIDRERLLGVEGAPPVAPNSQRTDREPHPGVEGGPRPPVRAQLTLPLPGVRAA